jgi:hypothetical protein
VLAFLIFPFVQFPAVSAVSLTGVQIATLGGDLSILLLIPCGAVVAAAVAGTVALRNREGSILAIVVTLFAGFSGLIPFIIAFDRLAYSSQPQQIGTYAIFGFTVLGSGFWLSLLSLFGVLYGAVVLADDDKSAAADIDEDEDYDEADEGESDLTAIGNRVDGLVFPSASLTHTETDSE